MTDDERSLIWFQTLPADGREVLIESYRKRPFAPKHRGRLLEQLTAIWAWRVAGKPIVPAPPASAEQSMEGGLWPHQK